MSACNHVYAAPLFLFAIEPTLVSWMSWTLGSKDLRERLMHARVAFVKQSVVALRGLED